MPRSIKEQIEYLFCCAVGPQNGKVIVESATDIVQSVSKTLKTQSVENPYPHYPLFSNTEIKLISSLAEDEAAGVIKETVKDTEKKEEATVNNNDGFAELEASFSIIVRNEAFDETCYPGWDKLDEFSLDLTGSELFAAGTAVDAG